MSANPAVEVSYVAQLRDKGVKKLAAIKGGLKLIEDARWFTTSTGILLANVGLPVDHPIVAELGKCLDALNETITELAKLEVAAEKGPGERKG